MRARVILALVSIPLGLVLTAVVPSSAVAPLAPLGERVHGRDAEVARIRAHFDSVLLELPERNVAGLTPLQRSHRRALLTTLRDYRDAGNFPHNYDFPGAAVPYFVDRRTGVLCAVAHLVASTGRRDIVERVARADNNILVAQLARDTAFNRWLDAHGLTLAEAARIQVPYVAGDPLSASVRQWRTLTTGSSFALGGAVAASLWSARANANGSSRVGNALGALAGAAALGMGAATLSDDEGSPALGTATMLAGATSAWLSTRGVMRHRRVTAARREAERATVAPLLPVEGKSGPGIAVTIRF